MNMQTIQIMILLADSFIKLAPWRIVTETMDRIGFSASESLARNLVVIAAACGLCALPTVSIFGSLLLIGYISGTLSLHMRTGDLLFGHVLFGFYVGLIVWGGLWLGGRKLRTLLSLSFQSAG
jgi:hypothetical protein